MVSHEYGVTVEGEKVRQFVLRNAEDVQVKIIEFGATITNWLVPDQNGKMDDIVLGFDKLDGYEAEGPYFGAIVGRYANRIAKGEFKLGSKIYKLAKNNGSNHLHGGLKGFDKKVWQGESFTNGDSCGVTLKLISPEGEEGYPGELQIEVTYALNDEGELSVAYTAETNKRTVLNLSQHTYFNLKGHDAGDVLEHKMKIMADRFTPINRGFIPTGKLADVEKTPMDFRLVKRIGTDIHADFGQLNIARGYDHNYVLSEESGQMQLAARVVEQESGRTLEVRTDQPGVQFYSGNFLDGSVKGKNGCMYARHAGFCLETQHFPDSPNHKNFPTTVLKAGQVFKSMTTFRIGVV